MILSGLQTEKLHVVGTLFGIFCIGILTLSGCVGLLVKDYGYVAADDKKVRNDGQAVSISENVPSISQGYRPGTVQDPYLNTSPGHHGIDILGKTGTPVIACASGTVIASFFDIFYGHRVVIDHVEDENGQHILSKYFHMQKRLVNKGDKIGRGQQIGTLGRTGLLAGFPHLHYEIRIGDPLKPFFLESMNPHKFWVDGIGEITCYDSARQWPDAPFQTTYPVPCRGVDWK